MYIIIQTILLIIAVVYYNTTFNSNVDISQMSVILFLAYCSLGLHFFHFRNDVLKKYYLKHSFLAILGIYIVHFQLYTDYVFNTTDRNDSYIWVNNQVIQEGVFLSTLGLISFLLGFKIYGNKKGTFNKKADNRIVKTKVMVFLALALLLTYFATVNPLYLVGFYGVEDKGSVATYASLFFEVSIFAIIIQNCRNMILSQEIPVSFLDYAKKQGYILLTLIIIYFISVLFSGDRGPIMTLGLCYFSGYYFVTRKTISLKLMIVSIFLLASGITLLGEARNLEKKMALSEKLTEALNEKKDAEVKTSFLPQTKELANSIKAFHLTLSYIPEKHDFLYGHYQIQQIINCIPFISVVTPIFFGDQHIKYVTTADFITWIEQGNFPYSGLGTTCMADFYFDFGIIGIVIGMFLFGYFIRYCELNLYNSTLPGLFNHILIIVYLCQALYIARSSVLFELKTVVWIYILLYLNRRFLSKI